LPGLSHWSANRRATNSYARSVLLRLLKEKVESGPVPTRWRAGLAPWDGAVVAGAAAVSATALAVASRRVALHDGLSLTASVTANGIL